MFNNQSNVMFSFIDESPLEKKPSKLLPKFFDAGNKVTFKYVLEKNKKSILLMNKQFTQLELAISAINVAEYIIQVSNGRNTLFTYESKRYLNSILELSNLRKFNLSFFKKTLKKYPKDGFVRMIFDKKDEELIKDIVCARLYLYLYDKEENTNVCTVRDCEFDLDEVLRLSENWERHPITIHEGFKSKEEFIVWNKNNSYGVLTPKWTN